MNTFKFDFNHPEVSFLISQNFEVLFPQIRYRKKETLKTLFFSNERKRNQALYCVCVRERERERECVFVCVCVCV